jgi:hypothetical protein
MMPDETTEANKVENDEGRPHQVRLPGFIIDEPLGLGDVIKRVTSSVGIRPCGGCEARAAALNRWMVFSGKTITGR